MFAVAWKETLSNGSQPIRMKQFRTEDARADFIDTLRDNGVSFQITSMNISGFKSYESPTSVRTS